ncbi:MAG: TonB-dependent receptor plug [Gemmatimonadetes bacterium]|nr:TonB-dependent receptor plug [Gemmatimonadota bacterium]
MSDPSLVRRAVSVIALAVLVPASAFAQRSCEDPVVIPAAAATWTAPLDARVSLHVRDISLRDALDRLTALSGVQLAYSADIVPVDRRVCVGGERLAVGEILTALLRGSNVQVLVVSGRVVLAPAAKNQPGVAESAPHGVSVLERVVVTGNAVAAPRRPLVIGVEVIDGETMRRQALGSMSELLDASVPGLWSWAQSPSSLVSQYGGIRGASSFGASSPKIYIDGVEVANPLIVTQLNPDVIDRVEVIRGPQGSALYGSDAISGVINVLTRHDGVAADASGFQFRSTEGAASSAYASGLVPVHEQRLNVRTGTNVKSAGLSMVFGQTGALFPSSETRQLSATGDARLVSSSATYTMSARYFDKRSGTGINPLLAGIMPRPPQAPLDTNMKGQVQTNTVASTDIPQTVAQLTVSNSATFATQGRWTHSLLAGIDMYALNHVADSSGPFTSAVDTALRAARGNGDRITLRESSVAHFGGDDEAQGTLTLGIEQSVLRQGTWQTIHVTPGPGSAYGTIVEGLVDTWNHNTGVLSQLSGSWKDALYLTGGLRVERNDSFTGNNRYPLLPMLGVAAVRGYGDVELKLRAAYGKGIRPPQTPARSTATGYAGNTGYGSLNGVLPALDPEYQSGYEGGAELYIGHTLTLQLTRFDQRATGLIQNVATGIDTVARGGSLERRVRYQLQNVGEISNTGWEFQGNLSHGAFSLASSLTSVDSRVRALAAGYNGDLRPNDRMLAVPARTAALTASYLNSGWFMSLGATRAMDWINYDRLSLARAYVVAGPGQREVTGNSLRNFWMAYDGDTHLRFSTSRDLSHGMTLLVAAENLLGGQLGEPDNVTIRPGRTITAGLRASF